MTAGYERNAAQDAPSDSEFNRLFAVTGESDSRERRLEDQFITVGSGRLTMRSGELLHFNPEWVDTTNQIIRIPNHDGCSCRYCRERAAERADEHEDVEFEEALKFYWKPKYDASVRAIPYGYSERVVDVVETFADEVGYLDIVQSTVNRRVNTLQERAGIGGRLYPHSLRAAAGFYWARKGLEAVYLQALMGWKDMRVANRYIRATGRQLDNRIQQLASTTQQEEEDDDEAYLVTDADELPDPTDAVHAATTSSNPRSEPEYLGESSSPPSSPDETAKTTLAEFTSA
ncbi:tyrosine-type recombinase/integrase [Halobacterium salinarum]|uniref:tyrosine-type recombinase/integrase n=1 Tax=Halobacterium salinarum TaxID=2242 RepID=UPI0025573267|nr:tyrosine-type recombinase/integrase [Halobacterium salinarum]MDL0135147.1 tyrosine-type recombinase/integrase [Halobacterium salinarum]